MGYISDIKNILIVILVIIIIFLSQCNGRRGGGVEPGRIISDTIIEWDTVTFEKEVYIPKWKTKTETIIETITQTDTITLPIDTASVIGDFYTKYYYSDTINIDTIGYVIVDDTIYLNKIYSRNILSKFNIPSQTITNTVFLNKTEFYVGFGVAGGISQLNYVGGEFLLRTKKRSVYGVGLGIDQNLKPVLTARMFWKLGK